MAFVTRAAKVPGARASLEVRRKAARPTADPCAPSCASATEGTAACAGIIPAHAAVPSVALAQDGAHGSAVGLAALRRTSKDARAPGTFAARVTNAIRIRRCRGCAATRSAGPGVYATLCVCALRRRALRYDPPPATSRPGSLRAADR